MIIVRIWLHQIYNIKTIDTVLFDIANFEVEPLSVALRTIIVFEIEIVFGI